MRTKQAKWKRVAAGCLALMLAAVPLSACTVNDDPGVLEINWTLGGYGDAYCQPLMDAFTAETGIECTPTYDNNSASVVEGQIGSVNRTTTDLFIMMVPSFPMIDGQKNRHGYENTILELTDFYEEIVPGTDSTLKEWLKEGMYEANQTDDGKIYTVPWISPMDGLAYNKLVLDQFGIDYLPRTTDEFIGILDQIKSGFSVDGKPVTTAEGEKIYGLISANNSAYWAFVWPTWWAQYEGMDNVYNYFQAKLPDAAENSLPDWQALRQEGKRLSIVELDRFIAKDNGYMHPDSLNRDNLLSQIDFLDGKVAFIPTGDWMEQESIQAYREAGIEVDARFMKTPVTSYLGVKLGITEAELRAAIDYVDIVSEGGSAAAPTYSGKSAEESAEITRQISEARLLVSSSQASSDRAIIPAYSNNIEGAKQFLLFFASPKGQEIMAKYSGATSPFRYEASDEVKSGFSTFTTSAMEITAREGVRYWIDDFKYPIRYKANLLITYWNTVNYQRGFEEVLYSGTKTPQQVYNEDWSSYRNNWDRMLSQAGY